MPHRARDRRRYQCFNCSQHGHVARDCPRKRYLYHPRGPSHPIATAQQVCVNTDRRSAPVRPTISVTFRSPHTGRRSGLAQPTADVASERSRTERASGEVGVDGAARSCVSEEKSQAKTKSVHSDIEQISGGTDKNSALATSGPSSEALDEARRSEAKAWQSFKATIDMLAEVSQDAQRKGESKGARYGRVWADTQRVQSMINDKFRMANAAKVGAADRLQAAAEKYRLAAAASRDARAGLLDASQDMISTDLEACGTCTEALVKAKYDLEEAVDRLVGDIGR